MDLAQFESRKHADEGVDFPLINTVTGEKVIGNDGLPVTFRLGHWDGPRIRAAVNARRKQRNEDKKKVGGGNVKPDSDAESDRDSETADDLATMTTGWSANFDLDGQPCPFSQEKAAEIYFRFPEIALQMGRNASDRANFLLGLAKT